MFPKMRANSAALASPAEESGGSTETADSFSAWRITTTVVEFAVNQTHIVKSARLNIAKAAIADNQIGIKNGLR
jgi:hypothetical protein